MDLKCRHYQIDVFYKIVEVAPSYVTTKKKTKVQPQWHEWIPVPYGQGL